MTTLEQLLNNFAEAAIDYSQCGPNGGLLEDLKAAQDAIVAHVEGAMGDARNFAYDRVPFSDTGESWENLVREWTK